MRLSGKKVAILVEEGLARRSGDTIRAVKAPERPEITTGEAADMIPVLDKALQLLPEVLESGKKPEYSRVKALTAKLVGSFGVRLEFEAAVEVSGLDKLPESSVVLDVFPRVGTSTATLLELTRAGILAVEPYPENLEVLEGLVKLQGVGDRVRLVHAAPLESMRIQERVDAAFMGEVLHWTPSPQMVLRAVRNHMKRDSFLVLAQTVYSSLGMKVGLLGYLLGALRLPPTSGELRSMLRVAGFKVDKWLESMGVALVRARPMVTFV